MRNSFVCSFPDKVFGPESSNDTVYEDGVKTVALSALMGINGNIFPPIFN